jgi:hypothetical protein
MVVDIRIRWHRSTLDGTIGIHDDDTLDYRLLFAIEARTIDERNSIVSLVEFYNVVLEMLRKVPLGPFDRLPESLFVVTMKINGIADLFPNPETFRS